MGEKELKTEQAVINRFQELRNELNTLSSRANELAAESREHDLVLKALEPMDGDRKCYRVVGSKHHPELLKFFQRHPLFYMLTNRRDVIQHITMRHEYRWVKSWWSARLQRWCQQ